METIILMPDLATNVSSIRIIRWLVPMGQMVRRGQVLLEVETDKAVMEIEALASGELTAQLVQPDDQVEVGTPLARIGEMGGVAGVAPAAPVNQESPIPAPPAVIPVQPSPASGGMFARNRTQRAAAPPPAQDPAFLLGLYERMVRIREFEDGVKFLFLEGTMPGTIHQCQGQEATAVGVCTSLRPDDWITSTFRGHGHALAKGLSMQELLDELFGATTGCCQGKGGSMHVGNPDLGMLPGIAIVGGGIPLAAGMALAFRQRKTGQIAVCFFGDGAVAEGAFHEGINMAAIWNLPVLFVCENNRYGASTRFDTVMRRPDIAGRAADCYGIPAETVDGNDVLAVHAAATRAVAVCRAGQGPAFLELQTYRLTGHSRRDACNYQPKEERVAAIGNDPIPRFAAVLQQRGLATASDLDAIHNRVIAEFQAAVVIARQAPQPTLADLTTHVFA